MSYNEYSENLNKKHQRVMNILKKDDGITLQEVKEELSKKKIEKQYNEFINQISKRIESDNEDDLVLILVIIDNFSKFIAKNYDAITALKYQEKLIPLYNMIKSRLNSNQKTLVK